MRVRHDEYLPPRAAAEQRDGARRGEARERADERACDDVTRVMHAHGDTLDAHREGHEQRRDPPARRDRAQRDRGTGRERRVTRGERERERVIDERRRQVGDAVERARPAEERLEDELGHGPAVDHAEIDDEHLPPAATHKSARARDERARDEPQKTVPVDPVDPDRERSERR